MSSSTSPQASGSQSNPSKASSLDEARPRGFNPHTTQVRASGLPLSPYYDLAHHIASFAGLHCVIDIGGASPRQLTSRFAPQQIVLIGNRTALRAAAPLVPKERLFLHDFSAKVELPESLVSKSVIICPEMLSQLDDPSMLVESLASLAKVAPFIIVGAFDSISEESTEFAGAEPEKRTAKARTLADLRALFQDKCIEIPFSGTIGGQATESQRRQSLLILGTHCLTQAAPPKSVVALVSCFNDIDIIRHSYEHLKSQGVAVAFIDNWSSDGTWELIQEWRKNESQHCVHSEQFPPTGASNDYEWSNILLRKANLAQELDFDWFIHYDSDEIRESPVRHLTLAESISRIDALGYTAIDHTVIDFRPIDDSFTGEQCPKSHFSHFEFGDRIDHFIQVKGWKRQPQAVDLFPLGGHVAFFPNLRLYPLKFLLRHYSIRSPQHAQKKFFRDRLPRIEKEMASLNWHTHLASCVQTQQKSGFLWPKNELHAFSAEQFDQDFLLERTAGFFIHPENREKALVLYVRPRSNL